MSFTFQRALDRGTSTPCVARTALQAGRLVGAFTADEDQKQAVVGVAYQVMEHLVACLEVIETVEPQITAGIAKVDAGLERQGWGKAWVLPSVPNLRKHIDRFLQSAKFALRDTGRLFEVFYGKTFDHRFDKARRWAEEEFGVDSELARMLRDDAEWIERVLRWRNAVEHPRDSRGELYVDDFRVVGTDPSGEPLVTPPKLYQGSEDPVPILEYLQITQENTLRFFEDVLANLLLLSPNPFGIMIREIPKDYRDPKNPIRLVPHIDLPEPGT